MSTFNPPAPLNPLTKARSVDINALTDSVATAFAALPSDSDLNNGTVNFGVDSGTANTYVVNLPRPPTGYVDGLRVVFTPLNSNTGASTVNVNGLGVKSIRLQDNTATEAGTLVAGIPKTLIYGATLGNFFVEANSVTSAMEAAAAAAASASAASGSASTASTAAGVAVSARDIAVQAAADAQAIQLIGTSASSVLIGIGTKNYTASTGKQWAPGTPIQATDAANVANFNNGTVTSYNPATGALVMETTLIGGSGTISSWNISVVGQRGAVGATGSLAGGNLTGALNNLRGTSPTSSATPDIWNAGGNMVPIVQTATITGFPAAPQAGAQRTLFAASTFVLQNGANLFVRGGTRTINPGDRITIDAATTTTFEATIERGNGMPVSAQVYMRADIYLAAAVIPIRASIPHRAILIGPGGSGARAQAGGAASNATASATGGAGGGMVIKDFDGIAGNNLTFSAGAPGSAPASANSNGNAGGTSTLTGNGLSLTANGGNGGNFSATSPTLVAGALGGTATGGDINIQGGNSGSCAANVFVGGPGANAQATGGGSVGWKGVAYSSGNVLAPVVTGSQVRSASGGAGIGGASGNVAPAAAQTTVASGAGGSVTAGVDATTNGVSANGVGQTLVVTMPLTLNGSGGTSQAGGGSPAATSSNTPDAGMFGGTGGVAVVAVAGAVGAPGAGSGSGGAASADTAATTVPAGGISIFLLLY